MPGSGPAAACEVAGLVAMPGLLHALGFAVNTRTRRSCCVLHQGHNPTAFSWRDDGRWFCHSCGTGGDKLRLVEEVRKCNFLDALRFLAALAGIKWSSLNTDEVRHELAEAKKKAEHINAATKKLQSLQKHLVLDARKEVLGLHRLRRNAGARLAALRRGQQPRFLGESELAWSALALVARQELRAATAYTVLAFGSEGDRVRCALQPGARNQMIEEALERGFVEGDSGAITEVRCG